MTKSTPADLAAMVNKTLGKDTVRMGSDASLVVKYQPTGLLPFDILLQGGMPRGRFVEMYGDYSTLKSYVGLQTIRSFQQSGLTAALIDTERAYEPSWAQGVGIDTKKLIVWPPRDDDEIHSGEEAMDVSQTLIANGVDLIIYDSVAASLPEAESEKRLSKEKIQPGRLAALMSAGLRRLTATNTDTSMLFINQTRTNIGVTFGSNEALPGGKALPFYASYRIAVRKTGKITQDTKFYNGEKWQGGKEQIGQKFKAEVTKSKLSKPFREIWFDWNLVNGQIDLPGFLISQGMESGIVSLSGSTWRFEDRLKVVGRQNFKDALAADEDSLFVLENMIRTYHDIPLITQPVRPRAKKAASKSKPIRKMIRKS